MPRRAPYDIWHLSGRAVLGLALFAGLLSWSVYVFVPNLLRNSDDPLANWLLTDWCVLLVGTPCNVLMCALLTKKLRSPINEHHRIARGVMLLAHLPFLFFTPFILLEMVFGP